MAFERLEGPHEGRLAPPPDAENFSASDFTTESVRGSRWLPGEKVRRVVRRCPACKELLPMEHGDRVRCECGLVSELYGNALTVWREID